MALTDTTIRTAKPREKQFKLSDSRGLYLLVKPNGGKYWRLKYQHGGKEKLLALGVYPEISLKEAREKCDHARKIIREGIDPCVARKEEKHQIMLQTENSFNSIALEWHEVRKHAWTTRHADYVLRRLQLDVLPTLGHRPLAEIKPPELLSIIRSIEARGAIDIAHRILQTCGQIFRYAIASGRAERDISTDLRGALKTRKKSHFAAIKEVELPEFLAKLKEYDGHIQTKLAIQLLMLTFVRTSELRAARWEEIDLDKAEWRIPAERMKMRKEHIVPLSKQVIEVLQQLKALNGDQGYVFLNRTNPHKCMSENTILYALYRMGYHSRATGHGFRATASTILNEQGYRPDVIERQLAHSERNKVRASYNHAEYLPERRQMMQEWADYLERVSGHGEIIQLNLRRTA